MGDMSVNIKQMWKKLENRIKKLERNRCCNRTYFYGGGVRRPNKGRPNILYIDKDSENLYLWDGDEYVGLISCPEGFLDLVDVPNTFIGESRNALIVNQQESGLEFLKLGTAAFEDVNGFIKSESGATYPRVERMYVTDKNNFENLTLYDAGTLYIILDEKTGYIAKTSVEIEKLWGEYDIP